MTSDALLTVAAWLLLIGGLLGLVASIGRLLLDLGVL